MSTSINIERYPAFVRRIAGWWRNWAERGATLTALQRMGPDGVERLARDVGLTGPELQTLAGRWPDSAELLSQRLAALKLEEGALKQSEPQVVPAARVLALRREAATQRRSRRSRDQRDRGHGAALGT